MMLAALHMDEAQAHQKVTTQNDELARQIALLEHAKSQAAIQQAQARQAVQMRQEHMANDRALTQGATDGGAANGVRIPASQAVPVAPPPVTPSQERQYPAVEEQDWREKWGLNNLPGYQNPAPVAEVHEREASPAQPEAFRPAPPEAFRPAPPEFRPAQPDVFRAAQP